MCICGAIIIVICLSIYLFPCHIVLELKFRLKSTDLPISPHISLILQNPQIHDAILRFTADFYCEIHGFCGNPWI